MEQRAEQLTATGFLALGPINYELQDKELLDMEVVDEQLDALGRAMLGMTIGCARCHDHKFDPIPTRDYYAMAGIFRSTKTLNHANVSDPVMRELPVPPRRRRELAEFAAKERELQAKLATAVEELGQLAGKTSSKGKAVDPTSLPGIAAVRKDVSRWKSELSALRASAPRPAPRVMSVSESETPGDSFICIRGNVHNQGEIIPRGFLRAADSRSTWEMPANASGRRELAQWLCRSDHPLTARVLVNRVWQHLLGRGLVDSPDNFGRTGRLPSHPELLNYLALRFVECDWSIKHMVRAIVRSRVYTLSSQATYELVEADAENHLLGRAHRRRLDEEVIRDAMLRASGQLDPRLGGAAVKPGTTSEIGYDFTSRRRSAYVPVFRNAILDLFEVFDAADPNIVMGKRTPSTRPTQALFLMNSPFVIEQARRVADRILDAHKASTEQRLRLATELILSRPPTSAEEQTTRQFVMAMRGSSEPPQSERDVWTSVCQSLLACLDFRYLK